MIVAFMHFCSVCIHLVYVCVCMLYRSCICMMYRSYICMLYGYCICVCIGLVKSS